MRSQHNRQRNSGSRPRNIPTPWRKTAQVNHTTNARHDEQIHPLKALEDLRHLLEEIRRLGFLGSSAPLHVDAEHVREESEEDVEGDAAEEDGEHGHPLEVLDQGGEEGFFAETVAEDGKTDVAGTGEDDEERDEDTPGFDVEFVDVAVVPAYEEVVEYGQGETKANCVICFLRDLG